MNITAKNVASKLFVAFVAAAMLFTLATPAKAATVEELQAQIAALMAQISGMGGSTSSAACTFTRPLTVGSQGADVKCLQDALTPTYFNNAGGSTGYFGPVTASAVAAWQAANGVSPAAGYFGPISQAKFASLSTGGSTGGNTGGSTGGSKAGLSGEASLDSVEISDGEDADDVEEGSEDAEVAEIEVKFEDGDAMITRLDIALVPKSTNTETRPWRVFDEVSLWVDGDEVARKDVSSKDDYLDDEDGSIRFSGLDIVAEEDEEVTIVVAVTTKGNLKGVDNGEDWKVFVGSIRFIDGDDVTTTETATGDIVDLSGLEYTDEPAAEFTIDEIGEGDDLEVKTSRQNPDTSTISVDEDKNVEAPIFAFDLSAEDSDGDVEIQEVTIVATVTTAADNMNAIVNKFRLEIDGESFKAESYNGGGANKTVTVTFDIDGDIVIDADDVVTAVLYADFEDMSDPSYEGTVIQARVTAIEAEGVRSGELVDVDGLPRIGKDHTLRTAGIDVTRVSRSARAYNIDGNDNDYGEYEMEVDITAFGEDAFIANTGAAFTFQIEDSTGATVATGTATSSTITSDADLEDGYYRINKGETERFTLRVTYDPLAAGEGQDYRVQFLDIIFNDDADTNTPSTETLTPASTFETQYARIAD